MPGVSDEVIIQQAMKEDKVLLTKDKDFGGLVIRAKMPTAGVLLIRTEQLNDQQVLGQCASLIDQYALE